MHTGLYLLLFTLCLFSFAVMWVGRGPSGVSLPQHGSPVWQS